MSNPASMPWPNVCRVAPRVSIFGILVWTPVLTLPPSPRNRGSAFLSWLAWLRFQQFRKQSRQPRDVEWLLQDRSSLFAEAGYGARVQQRAGHENEFRSRAACRVCVHTLEEL